MPNLFKITTKAEFASQKLDAGEIASIVYHDIFDFPLNLNEMIKWRAGRNLKIQTPADIAAREGYFFLEGKEGIVYKRTLRKRISERKMEIARKASKVLSYIPFIEMAAVTGSLAMGNSGDDADIDLMVITKPGRLWTSRLLAHLLVNLTGFKVRKAGDRYQKDKLCMNIWMDGSDLVWRKGRNIYTAHEIAQVVPLINKNKTYEQFIFSNRWILKFWPNSVKVSNKVKKVRATRVKAGITELIAYKAQYLHMRSKITREVVKKDRALFHPQDWGSIVLERFFS